CGKGTIHNGTATENEHDVYKDPARWNGISGDYDQTILIEQYLNGSRYVPGALIAPYIFYAGASGGGQSRARNYTEFDELTGVFCDAPLDPSGKTFQSSLYISFFGILDDLEA